MRRQTLLASIKVAANLLHLDALFQNRKKFKVNLMPTQADVLGLGDVGRHQERTK